MLKKISVDHLRLGMHLHAFCGAWIDHPFWRTKFILKEAKDLELIRHSIIKEVWIDAVKGLDVERGQATEEADDEISDDGEHVATKVVVPQEKLSLEQEVQRAARICAKAKEAVVSMFQEARMGNAVDADSAMVLVEEISNSVLRNPGALISLARLKTADDYTYMHSVAVCAMMVGLAKQLGLDEEQTRLAGMAGLMHDLGKALMPMEVLNKPGKLTDAEFAIIKSHPVEGHRLLLTGQNVHPLVLDVCLHHHEKTDGSGYPKGLKDDQISLFAKMGAVCDVYDAITSNRPYKSGWDPAESLRKMAEWANGHFDGKVFQAFVKSLGIYPIGSLVKLTSGRLGVVVSQTGKSLTTPCVKVFYSTKSSMRIVPEVIDLSVAGCTEKIVSREDPAKWRFSDLNSLWSGMLGTSS